MPTLDGFPVAVPLSHAHPGIGASDLPRKLDLSTAIPRIRSTSGAERPIPWVDSIQRRDPEILASSMTDRPRILFLCTANACRSQIAQGLLEVLAPDRYESLSAGIRPAGFVHEFAQIVVEEV